MATRLTPDTLRRLVLEEKAKVERQLDKAALKELALDAEEEGDWSHPKGQKTVKQTAGKKLATLKMLKEHEEKLRKQLRETTERRLALRRQLMNEID
jgi:signal recognition particle subunit SEC65